MTILLALLAGILGLVNFSFWQNTVLAIICTVFTLISVFTYRGRRSRKSYQQDGTRIFTLPFAVCLISFIGNLAIAAGFLLHLA